MIVRRRALVALLGALLLVAIAALVWPRDKEPSYEGKPLSTWLYVYRRGGMPDGSVLQLSDEYKATKAVRAIGPKAVPLLLTWMNYKVPNWRIKLLSAFYKHVPVDYRLYDALVGPSAIRSELALTAFQILGGDAREAVGELTRLMNAGNGQAALALGYIGKEGLPALLAVLSDQHSTNRAKAAIGISATRELRGINSTATVALLLQCLKDQDGRVARSAALALGELAIEPDTAVPALAETLNSADPTLRVSVLTGLCLFKDKETSAVPAVVIALSDPDLKVRLAATNTLSRIAPAVLRERQPH
jgi:hypothetical protein